MPWQLVRKEITTVEFVGDRKREAELDLKVGAAAVVQRLSGDGSCRCVAAGGVGSCFGGGRIRGPRPVPLPPCRAVQGGEEGGEVLHGAGSRVNGCLMGRIGSSHNSPASGETGGSG
jgi:hypothetical protein